MSNRNSDRIKIMKSKMAKWRRANVRISRKVRDIIHGYIASEGYVKPEGNLQVQQSSEQKNFVIWLFEKLNFLTTGVPIQHVQNTDKRTGKITTSFKMRFYTRNLLEGFRNMWYKPILDPYGVPVVNSKGQVQYQKVLPKSFASFFTGEMIAVWYAGDGTTCLDSKGVKIEVTAFTVEDRLLIKKLFKEKHNINSTITQSGLSKKGTPQWNLSISAHSYAAFHDLVTKNNNLLQTCFPHKLHKKPLKISMAS